MTRRTGRVRAGLFGAAVVVLVAFGLLAFGRRVADRIPDLGVTWVPASAGPTAAAVDPHGPAARGGLLPGDVLVRVEGRPVRTALEAEALPWSLPRDRAVAFDVSRGGRGRTLFLEVERRPQIPAWYGYLALVGLAFLASSAFAALRLTTVRGARVYAALGATLYLMLIASPTGRGDRLDWVLHVVDLAAGAIAPALLVHLAVALSRRSLPAPRFLIPAAYAPAVGIATAAVWIEGLGGARMFLDPAEAVTSIDRALLLFLGVAILAGAAILARAYVRTPSGLHRSQLRWMLWGLGLGLGPLAVGYAIPWALGADLPGWASVGVLPVLLVPAAFSAALARYRLHDLDLVLRKGLAGAALAVVTVAVYAVTLVGLRLLAEPDALPDEILGFLAALVTAIAYPKLRAGCAATVDRAFYRARYADRATLLEWGRSLHEETELAPLVGRLEDRIRDTLGVGWARVLLRTGPQRFEETGEGSDPVRLELEPSLFAALEREGYAALPERGLPVLPGARHAFATKVRGRITALFVLPERSPQEPPLSTEDRRLLSTLGEQTGAAIEAARVVREIRQHADQVETLKARQERILESSGVGLLLSDANGRILAWNRRLEAIYGLPRHEAIGRRLSDVFPLQTIRRLDQAIAEAAPGEEARVYGHPLVNRSGRRILVDVSVSPIGAGGHADGARVTTFDDVTERTRIEDQMARQERLASLGLLAAGVAHEVNTPLTGISSYTQMLLDETRADDPGRGLLEKIEIQSRRASEIANSLLNLARPERAAFEALDLNEAVREVLRLFEPQLRGGGLRLDTELEPDLPRIVGHRGKLQQVVLNLLLNAKDAVSDRGTIRVATRTTADRIVLEVADDGVGIAEEDLPRVFDPFFTTKARGKGSGLGLSISYGIVREHEGEMHAESVPGEFTRFRVEIPRPRHALATA